MTNHEATDREVLLSIYSDVYKDVYGCRPRGILSASALTDEEIEAKLAVLEAELQVQLDEEHYQEEQTLYQKFYGEE